MSTAGEAASLFGVPDPAADPFATVLGSDDADVTLRATNETSLHEQRSIASDIFGSGSESSDWLGLDGTGGTAPSRTDYASEQSTWQHGAAQASYSYGAVDATSTVSYHPQYGDQYGQASSYGQPQQQESTAYGSYEQSQFVQSYNPYAPQAPAYSAPYAPPPPVSNSLLPRTESVYDPYRPTVPVVSSVYTPAVPPSPPTQPYHSPYQPAAPQLRPEIPPPQPQTHTNGTSAGWTPQLPQAKPPPPSSAAGAEVYRPKTSNAYDPPLPPPKHARHPVVRQQSHPVSPPIIQSTHANQRPFSPLRNPPLNYTDEYAATSVPPVQDSYAPTPNSTPQWTNGSTAGPAPPPPPPPQHRVRTPDVHYSAGTTYQNGLDSPYQLMKSTNGSLHSDWNESFDASNYIPDASHERENNISQYSTASVVDIPHQGRFDRGWTPSPSPSDTRILQGAPRRDQSLVSSSASAYEGDYPVVAPGTVSSSPNGISAYERHHSPGLSQSPDISKSPWETVSRPASVTHEPSGLNGVDVYSPSIVDPSPGRVKSPSEASVHSSSSIRRQNPPTNGERSPSVSASPPAVGNTFGNVYSPGSGSNEAPSFTDAKRTASPTLSIHSVAGSSRHNTYSPAIKAISATYPRVRSASNSSAFSISSSSHDDPYAPARHLRQQASEGSILGSTLYEKPSPLPDTYSARTSVVHDRSGGQTITLAPPVHTAYAPSPSLLGTNDPLGRASARIPVFSFSFGGRLVTCFHGSSMLNTGFDVALSSRPSTEVKIYVLHKVLPEAALETSGASYPGPLFSDPGTPSTSIVRTGVSAQTKTKKARVVKYLEERAEEISLGLGYFHSDSLDGRRSEAKHILVLLLKVMVENDGRLSGNDQVDAAVRAALVPRLGLHKTTTDALRPTSSLGQAQSADAHIPLSDIASASSYPVLGPSLHDPHDSTVAVHTVRASHLDKIQDFLLRGDRHAACHYASDEKLWAHAMIIASSIDKATWKEVVTEFVRTELVSKDAKSSLPSTRWEDKAVMSNGREALRVAYSHYAGQGPASVQELLPPKPLTAQLSSQTLQLPPPSISSITPISPNFPALAEAMTIPADVLAKWADTAAMIVSSPMSMESFSTLTALGDQLSANQWFEAAHVCYLLAPQTSPMGGVGSASRLVLLGSPSPSTLPNFAKDQDPIIFSEIAEFALSLATPSKGQEVFAGLPHLQPYRLIRAAWLAEMGHVQQANRYCDAISNSLSRNSPYINSTFVEQLKGLSDRLIAAPQLDKSGSWIGSKMAKPSLDSIGTWLEGRFTKFIAGEGDSPMRGPEDTAATPQQQAFAGPFTHYSTISTTSSAIPSPRQSTTDLTEVSNPPPFRTGSAMAVRSGTSQAPINRASSAMDYVRPFNRKASPIPRVSSASATTTTFADASLYSQTLNGYAYGSGSKQRIDEVDVGENEDASLDQNPSGLQMNSWWGSADSGAPTPTATSFTQVEDAGAAEPSGFISLMDDPPLSTIPVASRVTSAHEYRTSPQPSVEEDDDDLGLGNSSSRAKHTDKPESEHTNGDAKETAKSTAAPERPELKPAGSGSWFTRIWKRETTPGPVKANLGEQTSFYYDKELKRWVNKSGGAEATAPSSPPPPPRAQTASPGRSNPTGTPLPPPARPATAVDLTHPPPRKPPMRVRSNLVPAESDSSTSSPSTPSTTLPLTPGAGPPPPPGGRRGTQGKRAVRSRYVDVFQQEAQGGS